jgi:hypothetical protein
LTERKNRERRKVKGDKKPNNNVGGGNTEKIKSKYLCNLCMEDHPTHLCPQLAEAQNLLVLQQPDMLMNPFQHGKNMNQASSSVDGGNQGPPTYSSNPSATNVYMMKGGAYIATRAHDYGMSKTVEKGKEVVNPSVPLQIEKTIGETMTCNMLALDQVMDNLGHV